MKYFLLLIIRLYQTFIPKIFRGKCLFKESCSNYVYRITKEEGLKRGLKALKYRFLNCRPNYYLIEDKGQVLLITDKNEVIEEIFIGERILAMNEKSSIIV